MGVAKYPINKKFFEDKNEEYWYFLGLVSSDGYISDDRIEIGLNNKDEHILVKLRNIICPEKPLYEKKSTHSVKFTIHSKEVASYIKSQLGMVSNKKHLEINYPLIPSEMLRHYIRGLIDGDGCIDTTKAYRGDKIYIGPRLRILGNRQFLVDMLEDIRKQVNNNTKSVNKKGREGVWYITYNFNVARDILEWCYNNNKICLYRKYNKFKEVCEMKI
jgi:intein/homing endonuclease